jgi:hypothetical protein
VSEGLGALDCVMLNSLQAMFCWECCLSDISCRNDTILIRWPIWTIFVSWNDSAFELCARTFPNFCPLQRRPFCQKIGEKRSIEYCGSVHHLDGAKDLKCCDRSTLHVLKSCGLDSLGRSCVGDCDSLSATSRFKILA